MREKAHPVPTKVFLKLGPDMAMLFSHFGYIPEELSDLLHFYPIDWKIAVNLCQYEIFLFTNRYNWVDIDGTENSENTPTLIRFSLTSLSGHVGGKGRGGGVWPWNEAGSALPVESHLGLYSLVPA